ncbi:metalloregulator ArsR/SmtB family transcription factor [Pasteurella multocida]|uniref:ArsR/SmtB family transcription factor n=1 Tax=Pasteurella multocida TaxID=747 RepID=UPI0020205FC9|nr:metalloregulator ArsR/SmtB family transcription factor [Pasteurella multocida]MCL7796497.1 metalloregulator ArsR/SmtB family transcription factor [Pasteurella multocida]
MEEIFSKYDEATKFLKSFSNQNRLIILCCILDQKRNVTEITQLTGLPQASVSNQLALLRENKLIDCEKRHRERLYYIADPRVLEIMRLLHKFFCQ